VTSCDPRRVTLLCNQAKIDVCRLYDLTPTAIFGSVEQTFQGMKVPKSESSRERKFQGATLLGAKVRGNESSSYHTGNATDNDAVYSVRWIRLVLLCHAVAKSGDLLLCIRIHQCHRRTDGWMDDFTM